MSHTHTGSPVVGILALRPGGMGGLESVKGGLCRSVHAWLLLGNIVHLCLIIVV